MLEMESVTQVQIVDEAVYTSHRSNTPEKGMNPIILTPAVGK